MEKMSKRITQDRIGALPDSVLLHILSFLNIKEVVKTSVLSKRWQYIWTSVPTLTFEYCLVTDESTDKFVAWVNRTLLLCRNTSIEKFKVDFICFNRFASDIDVWARFAAEKKLRDLSLHLLCSKSYSLPQSIYCNSFLTNLSIEGCRVVPRGGLSWISLKSLSIACVELNDDTIAKILTGSPMLEYLRISACWGISRLDINNDSLRELVIDDCFTMWNYQPLMEISARNHIFEISAPNLQSLHILGQLRRQFRLMSFSSLLRVELNLSCAVNDSDAKCETKCSYFIEILGSLHHVVELELCIQALLLLETKGLSSQLSHLTCLKLNAYIDKQDVSGIINLLKCSPNLEKLVVNKIEKSVENKTHDHSKSLSCLKIFYRMENRCWSVRRMENFPLPHLKAVKFLGFKKLGDVDEFTLALTQVLLENAGVLEKIVISVGEYQMLVMPQR